VIGGEIEEDGLENGSLETVILIGGAAGEPGSWSESIEGKAAFGENPS
jgi:hypothetical protein